jgi:hypothetical protein
LALLAPLLPTDLAAAEPMDTRTRGLFFGVGGCVAVADADSLFQGERLTLLAPEVEPVEIEADTTQFPDVPPCTETFRPDPPARVFSLTVPEPLQLREYFAARRLPDRILTGPGRKLSDEDARAQTRILSELLPARWQSNAVLNHAYRYVDADSHLVVEVYLGLPILNPPVVVPPIQSIAIFRIFTADGRILASEEYERVSGREERVDTEPPQLDLDNWSASVTERTVAFLSDDLGGTWKRLSTDVGFEGINWVVQALRPGLPEEQRSFLYTPH